MPLRQPLTGLIEPKDNDWLKAKSSDKKAFYRHAGDVSLARLRVQLSRGIGANGRRMKPRIQAVLPGGFDGPVMEPRYDASRVISLSDYVANDRGLLLFWQSGTGHQSHRAHRALKAAKKRAGAKPAAFGQILEWHAEGAVRNAPKRDVRLSKASIQQIRLEMRTWWQNRIRGRNARRRARNARLIEEQRTGKPFKVKRFPPPPVPIDVPLRLPPLAANQRPRFRFRPFGG